eukprot:CAMPEP_0175107904 /NCGR_PEP_ID=MMETSP0086_2-20121207/12266_1 /TAXON_ID=136419 /ORGANISM="Unknown Unknown, Strain D1" /LENGTH=49 /DNA_ID= /DNA_START= /DNA_END= /DNA_ORIENTATION=
MACGFEALRTNAGKIFPGRSGHSGRQNEQTGGGGQVMTQTSSPTGCSAI